MEVRIIITDGGVTTETQKGGATGSGAASYSMPATSGSSSGEAATAIGSGAIDAGPAPVELSGTQQMGTPMPFITGMPASQGVRSSNAGIQTADESGGPASLPG